MKTRTKKCVWFKKKKDDDDHVYHLMVRKMKIKLVKKLVSYPLSAAQHRDRILFVFLKRRKRRRSETGNLNGKLEFELICGPFERNAMCFDEHITLPFHLDARFTVSMCCRCCYYYYCYCCCCFAVWCAFCYHVLRLRALFYSFVRFLSVYVFVLNSINSRQRKRRPFTARTEKKKSTFFGKSYLSCCCCCYAASWPSAIFNSTQFAFK